MVGNIGCTVSDPRGSVYPGTESSTFGPDHIRRDICKGGIAAETADPGLGQIPVAFYVAARYAVIGIFIIHQGDACIIAACKGSRNEIQQNRGVF